jgi:hypothetical protein
MKFNEISQKTKRLKSWLELMEEYGTATFCSDQEYEFKKALSDFKRLISEALSAGPDDLGLVREEFSLKIANIERILEGFAEILRLEGSKSSLLRN